jgi:hypothetical protein
VNVIALGLCYQSSGRTNIFLSKNNHLGCKRLE